MEVTRWVWLLLIGGWLAFLLPLLWQRLHARRDGWDSWTFVLGGEMEGRYDYLREVFEGNASLVEALLGESPAPGGVERTRESTSWGLTALDGFVSTARERLEEWQGLARVVEAEIPGPLPRLQSGDFHIPEVRRIVRMAALSTVLDPLRGHRFERRLALLARGFGLVGRGGVDLAARLAGGAWATVRSRSVMLAHDFGALSRETLASARALLAALDRM